MDDQFLHKKLEERRQLSAFRSLTLPKGGADFFSNDYMGIVKYGLLEKQTGRLPYASGSTGSRLLAGNYPLIEETEKIIAAFHETAAALIFNSGYDTNFGLLSCIAGRGDTIFYDQLCHASIRDGVRQSLAYAFSFAHNDPADLEKKLRQKKGNTFVVTESVFSMDGDKAPLLQISGLCEAHQAHLIVDEAHATGVVGARGEGLVQHLGLTEKVFARIHTFGKALGCHGAAVVGSGQLKDYLINFCRPLIYSTALPPASVAAIRSSYTLFPGMHAEREAVKNLIGLFDHSGFKKSDTPIQCFIYPGNEQVKRLAVLLQNNNLDARPILYPTVPRGEERLRITLHSYNTPEETVKLISLLTANESVPGRGPAAGIF